MAFRPVQTSSGFRPLTQPKAPSRTTSAKEAFTGSLKSAGERFGRAQKAFSTGGNIFTKPAATMAALGGVGDVIASPFAGLTGFAQPELEKGVTKAVEKTPEGVKQFLSKVSAKTPESVKQFGGDALSASSIFALTGLGKEPVKGAVRQSIKKAGKAVVKSGKKSATATKSSFLDDLVRAKETPKVSAEVAKRSTEQGKGIFKRTVAELAPDEKQAKDVLMKIKKVSPKDTVQGVLNKADDALKAESKSLVKQLAKKDVIFPKKELRARMQAVADDLAKNINITGDKVQTVKRMMTKIDDLIDNMSAKGSDLLRVRKEFDKWIMSQKGVNIFGGNDDAVKIANKAMRTAMNDFLDEKAVGTAVKQSLRKQSSLIGAIDKLAVNAGAQAKSAPGRLIQNFEKALGKNKTLKEILGALAIGGTFATGTAPIAVGGLAAWFTGKGLINAVKSPQNRILLGKLLQELSKANVKTGAVAEINAIKQSIEKALTSQQQ